MWGVVGVVEAVPLHPLCVRVVYLLLPWKDEIKIMSLEIIYGTENEYDKLFSGHFFIITIYCQQRCLFSVFNNA